MVVRSGPGLTNYSTFIKTRLHLAACDGSQLDQCRSLAKGVLEEKFSSLALCPAKARNEGQVAAWVILED